MAEDESTSIDRLIWVVRWNGNTYDLRDLPIRVLDSMAKKWDKHWLALLALPLDDPGQGEELLRAVAKEQGFEVPKRITARVLLDAFQVAPDDIPDDDIPDLVLGDADPLSRGNETPTPG